MSTSRDRLAQHFASVVRSSDGERHVRVSKADILMKYNMEESSLLLNGIVDHEPEQFEFIPTHRVVSTAGNGQTTVDYVRVIYPSMPDVTDKSFQIEDTMFAATPLDYESGHHYDDVKFPSFMCGSRMMDWVRSRVFSVGWSGCTVTSNPVEYIEEERPVDVSIISDGTGVYFVQSGTHIKIGYTSDIKSRMAKIRTNNEDPFKMILFIRGATYLVEKSFHKQFAFYQAKGGTEWFEKQPVLDWLKSNGYIDPRTSLR